MPCESCSTRRVRVGIVSDTHGRLDPRVVVAFEGVDHILHAGDVGHPSVLWELQLLAPVTAVAGNVDDWDMPGEELPVVARLQIERTRVSVVHIRKGLPPHVVRESDVVVYGHSHMPLIQWVDSVLWINPGSASQARRSEIGRSVALLEINDNGDIDATLLPLSDFGEQQ
jgi:putative phosphoesterase